MCNERAMQDAVLVKALAAIAEESIGPGSQLVRAALRLAERLEGRPTDDAALRQHRGRKARATRRVVAALLAFAPAASHAADVSYATETCAVLRVQRPAIKRPIHVQCVWPGIVQHFYCPEVTGTKDHRMIEAEAFSEHCADPHATIGAR